MEAPGWRAFDGCYMRTRLGMWDEAMGMGLYSLVCDGHCKVSVGLACSTNEDCGKNACILNSNIVMKLTPFR
jgi:hypothetical protein